MSAFVVFVCPRCGPRVETFASAVVTCRCGRRCSHERGCACRMCVSVTCGNAGVVRQNRRLSAVGVEGGTGDPEAA
jgi:hypothetical protein